MSFKQTPPATTAQVKFDLDDSQINDDTDELFDDLEPLSQRPSTPSMDSLANGGTKYEQKSTAKRYTRYLCRTKR